jgi:hypothetical protein
MGFTATDIARIPAPGYEWYVFILDDTGDDGFRQEIRRNFDYLVDLTGGPTAMIIKGTDQRSFFKQVYNKYRFELRGFDPEKFPLPALFVTDTSPAKVEEDRHNLDKAKMMVFPMQARYLRAGDITAFYKDLAITLRDNDAIVALEKLDTNKVREKWNWLDHYVEFKPNFFGFEIQVNKMIEDLFFSKRS